MRHRHHRPRRAAPLAALCAVLSSCAQAPPAGGPRLGSADGRQCFYADNVNSFSAISDRLVNVSVGANEVFQFELFGACPEVDWAQRLAVVSRGSSWICSGLDATLIAPSAIGPQRCPVRAVRKLTPAQVAGLPAPQRP